jgi:hypothetical protein
MRRIFLAIAVCVLISTSAGQKIVRDQYLFHKWSVGGLRPTDSYTGWLQNGMIPDAAIDTCDSCEIVVRVRVGFSSPTWSFTFSTAAGRETTMTVPFSMDTATYTQMDFSLSGGRRAVTLIAVPVNYPPAPFVDSAVIFQRGLEACLNGQSDTTTGLMDSVRTVLALLRWGIAAISYTDSTFWKFHEAEIRKLDSLNSIRYWQPIR